MAEQSPLTWEQLLLLVRQLPEEDQEKLAYQVLKERGKSELNALLGEIGEQVDLKDLPSMDSILEWIDDFTKGKSTTGNPASDGAEKS